LQIRNNTFAKIGGVALVVDRFIGVSMLSNVFFQVDDALLMAGDNARFDRIDYNLYASSNGVSWTLGVAEPRTYNALTDWRSAYSTEHPLALIGDPDVNGIIADPLFVDSEHADFHFQPGSPAIHPGAGGERRGAYFDQGAVGASP
jgi:hypothetical protein